MLRGCVDPDLRKRILHEFLTPLALGSTAAASFSRGDWIGPIVIALIVVFTVLMMVRFGLLALAVQGAVGGFIEYGLLTNDFGAWYGESSLVVAVVVSALALWVPHVTRRTAAAFC